MPTPASHERRWPALSAAAPCRGRHADAMYVPSLSVTRGNCACLAREAGVVLASVPRSGAMAAPPSAMHAQAERDSRCPRLPRATGQHTAALSAATLCCVHSAVAPPTRVEACTVKAVPGCPQRCSPMLLSLSAMHARHERDSPQVQQPHARSECPAALSTAAQCRYRRAKCHARSTGARLTPSARAPHKKLAPCCPQRCSPMLLSPSAMHAQNERDSHPVHQSHTRSHHPAALSTAAQCCYRFAECHARSARA